MAVTQGKYERKKVTGTRCCPFALVPLFFALVELFAYRYLMPATEETSQALWPLAFGFLWAVIFSGLLCLPPRKGSRIVFGLLFGISLVWAVGQTGYYLLFSEMMWLSEFRYASEGVDYLDVILSYPVDWFVWIVILLGLGAVLLWKYPKCGFPWPVRVISAALVLGAAAYAIRLPQEIFERDSEIRYAQSDYGRMQSAEAVYQNMFNPHRLYQICGLYQMLAKDIYANTIYPLTPGHAIAQAQAEEKIGTYFAEKDPPAPNAMTGLLKDKNVVLVLMESMDDWMIGEHTPTIRRLMDEGINFTNFYTPPYGGIRTFNTEFCINTGSFLSSQGGYAFDYVTNEYNQSLASVLAGEGYSPKTFHYNDPNFYSREVFSEAMGYEEYVYYADYLKDRTEKEKTQLLYDDLLLFTEPSLRQEFFRKEEKKLNFIITRSAHLSYKYNEVLSFWGLKKYPEYKGITGNEETDCALLKARLVDDLLAELLRALEEEGTLDNTVIIGVTDHYTYGYKDEASLLELSGVEEKLLLEKTPCFIWSPGLEPMTVDKTLNTADFLPTVLNLLGIEPQYDYLGRDAFDESYEGYALFSDGSWIRGDLAYDAAKKKLLSLSGGEAEASRELLEEMADRVEAFTSVNNLILETDYYQE